MGTAILIGVGLWLMMYSAVKRGVLSALREFYSENSPETEIVEEKEDEDVQDS